MMGAGYLGKKAMSMDWDHDESFYRRAVWRERFAWTPKRCHISGRFIWLEKAVEGCAMWTGPGDPVFEIKWHGAQEHTVWLLKNNY